MKPTSTDLPVSPTSTPGAGAATGTPTPGAAPGSPTASDSRSTTFRPVEGGNEMQSGEKLLVEAYAAMWLLLFVMLLLWWRRQRAIDERVGALEAAVMKARADAVSAAKAARAQPRMEKAAEAHDA